MANSDSEPGRHVRIGDVAEAAGVSVGTVSNVINGRGNVSAKRRERVEAAIKKLSFSGSLLAKGMRSQRLPVVGLSLPNATSSNFVAISDALEAHAAAENYELVQVITRHDPAREIARIDRLIASRVSGVMLLPTSKAKFLTERLVAAHMPTVAINYYDGTDHAVDHVYVDQQDAFRLATLELIERGYERFIVTTQFPGFALVQRNLAGIRAAAGTDAVVVMHAGRTREVYGKELAGTLRGRSGKTVIVASSALLAAWTLEALRNLEIRVPDDVGLLCAEQPDWANAIWPTLSCIRQPTRELAQIAWDLLRGRISGNDCAAIEVRCVSEVNLQGSVISKDLR